MDGDNSVELCTSIHDMDDSQLVGAPVVMSTDAEVAATKLAVQVKTSVAMIGSVEKRKRGRPPRGAVAKVQSPKRQLQEDDEGEDVCFICFDGGSLVLCDRKGCPKAYHPSCIKRDEAFFRSDAKWTCGWHICSVCQKASQYMCYTCTYSVCKGCTRNADYFRIRGNKGFCSTCMRMIMLIEKIDQGNKEMVQVDFDDNSSWEYLFKVYWMYVKEKLSLTLGELIQAKSPCKESDAIAKRQRLPFGYRVALDGKGTRGNSYDNLELKKSKQSLEPPCKDPPSTENRTIVEPERLSVAGCTPQLELTQPIELELQNKDSLETEEASTSMVTSLTGRMEWASKELLELVARMKNGDTSALSHFDVQALLLEYIKRNNLRDPRQKSQIICDSRLKSLFGKPRVGHIEMLKLLEFHFLIKEGSQKSAFIPAGIVGTVTNHVEADDNIDSSFLKNKTKKRKSRRNSEEKLVQINLDEYGAIDAHNINLIYLRRNLMESLMEDMEKFHGRVIGSVVRIRISSNNQKQEMYRLVPVIGTSKALIPYKIGDKTADVLLVVLNLNKKEAVAIESISNQNFSEDECRRLRQIIKCGLVKRLTIGEIQKKAMELRAVKLNDSLEEEVLRLIHLRDRASENGRKKELRECVEKLELLKMPEERRRRLLAIPEVRADPNMDPNYESEEDAGASDFKKQVEYEGPRYTRFNRSQDKLMSSRRKAKEGSMPCKMSEKREAHGNNILKKLGNQDTACLAVDRSASETSIASLSTVDSTSANSSETDKLWHYRDPSSRKQGPFSVMQLRKWNKSGLFPPDMRIWTDDEHDDSVLLTNALKGLFHKAPRPHDEISHQSQELGAASVSSSAGACKSATGTGRECGEREVPWHLRVTNNHSNGNTDTTRMDGLSSSVPKSLDLNNSYSYKPRPSSPVPPSSHGNVQGDPPHGKRCHKIFQSSTSHMVQDSSGSTISQISDGRNHSMLSNSRRHLGQSSGQNWGSLTSNRSSVNINSGYNFASVTEFGDSLEQKDIKNYPDLPSPTPQTSYADVEAQAAEKPLSVSSVVPVCASNVQDLPSPTPNLKDEAPVGQAAADKESFPSSLTVQHSGSSWSSASSLVISRAQLHEIANGWGGCSPAMKPSVDSDLVSDSSLKPAETVCDRVDAPTSDANQLDRNSSSHPISNCSDWRATFYEPIEFSTLDEESVSDLLAEVDAMESQNQSGMASPTSAMRCSDEMIPVCTSDWFSSIEELTRTPDPANSDALISTEDAQLPCQSSLTDELAGASPAVVFDPLKRSSGSSSSSSEGET
ncbi:PREDICTED: zinc finger CCCH domain-containing protein 44-like isoform X1 [Nicotiana attenuata]|uniref:zinc finger CCCH domain-containing protein 44-like isoform X1 n=1 Tax=Nicotiana attenuata TaxID=49451 RepID=UPI000904F7EC|nr:PREDICTED: zinc finger CCCH domain-containing protein 44-like isoform X1 [Nicotiana attenuata]